MTELTLPKFVADKLERRWASRLEREAAAWRRVKPSPEKTTREVVDRKGRLVPVTFRRMPLKRLGSVEPFKGVGGANP
jgi:hypothetical protein